MNKIILRGGNLVDGTGRDPIEQSLILVEGDRISSVGKIGDFDVPKDAEVMDVTGKTVLPGLMDLHVHLGMPGPAGALNIQRSAFPIGKEPPAYALLNSVMNARLSLKAGFTTVRSMAQNYDEVWLRKAIEQGMIPGARVYTSRMINTSRMGQWYHPPSVNAVDGVDEMRKAVRERIRSGTDFIKILATGNAVGGDYTDPRAPQFTLEELKVAVEEAHIMGLKVACHAHGTEGMRNAVEAGADTIEHGTFMDDEILEMMIKAGTFYVPTLYVVYGILNKIGRYKSYPDYMYLKMKRLRMLENLVKSFEKAYEAGVKIATGTDSIGGDSAWELELMVKYGMTPIDAIVASTKTAAQALGHKELGTIEEAKVADLLVVDGDPLKNIALLKEKDNIKIVMKSGKVEMRRA